MSVSPSDSAAIYRACIVNAVKRSAALMADLVRQVREHWGEQPGEGVQANAAALRSLAGSSSKLVAEYPMALLELVAQGTVTAQGHTSAEGRPSRVEPGEARARMEMVRTRQQVAREAAPALTELDGLMGSVQGFERAQPERNPLRPGNYVRALYVVVAGAGVPDEISRQWLPRMQERFGALLSREYRQISDELRGQGIWPVHYTPTVRSRQGDLGGTTGYGDASSAFLAPSELGVLPSIESSLWDSVRPAGIAHADDLTVNAAPSAGAPTGRDGTPSAISGGRAAPQPDLARDVLSQMVETVVRDERLMPVVRHAVIRLEPVLRRLVQVDSLFFFDAAHPARRLLDRLTVKGLEGAATSAQWRSRFTRSVEGAVVSLTGDGVPTADMFERALRSLDAEPMAVHAAAPAEATVQPAQLPRPDTVAEAVLPTVSGQGSASLQLGDWVEIDGAHGMSQTKLTWCSPRQTLFLFTQADGSTQSMTARMVDKLLQSGAMRRAASS